MLAFILSTSLCTAHPFAGGDGTAENPYLIASPSQLNAIGTDASYLTACYKLTADIDLAQYSGNQFKIIGLALQKTFTGVFDGNYHVVRNFNYVTDQQLSSIGLFGAIGGEVKNLSVEDVQIRSKNSNYVGGLAGVCTGKIVNCQTSGYILGKSVVGGLVGFLPQTANSTNAIYFSSSVADVNGYNYIGGFFGLAYFCDITNCFAAGRVNGQSTVAGFAGSVDTTSCNIYNSYSASIVQDQTGLPGKGFAAVVRQTNLIACFWDSQRSGQTSTAGAAKALTTLQMQDQTTFSKAGWNFSPSVWAMPAETGYPVLSWQVNVFPRVPMFTAGTGTTADPYIISTPQEINQIACDSRLLSSCFKLIGDINFKGCAFNPIGAPDISFRGVFDGNFSTVSNICFKTNAKFDGFGFIRSLGKNAVIKNVALKNLVLEANDANYVGALVGKNNGSVISCSTDGKITGTNYVGGLLGVSLSGGRVENSYSAVNVIAKDYIGGLIGQNYSTIIKCHSVGGIRWPAGSFPNTGGFVGYCTGGSSESCYYDIIATGFSTSCTGTACYNGIMANQDTFAGWDFINTWKISPGRLYPVHKWEPEIFEGSGTLNDPYLIRYAWQIRYINAMPDCNIKLVADINLAETEQPAITYSTDKSTQYNFGGTFDGNNHTMFNFKRHFCFQSASDIGAGFFTNVLKSGTIKNLKLKDTNVVSTLTQSYSVCTGILVGINNGIIENCSVSGVIAGSDMLGGLAGLNSGIISECSAEVNIIGNRGLGGLVAANKRYLSSDPALIINCRSDCNIAGSEYVGGLVGSNYVGNIANSYSSSKLTGISQTGLTGYESGGSITNSFWDSEISGIDLTNDYSRTTSQLQTTQTFFEAGWDMNAIWRMCDDGNYPQLWWEAGLTTTDLACPDGVDLKDLAYFIQGWLEQDCEMNNECGRRDFNFSDTVDLNDFAAFAASWLSDNQSHND